MQSSLTLQVVHGSSGRAFPSRSSDGSYRSSPRSNGVSRRQDILRCVFVSVVVGLALWTVPLANGQWQRFENVSASTTALARREETVNLFECLPVPIGLVLQLLPEDSQCSIRQASGKAVILDHSTNVQIFDADHIEAANQVGCDLVQVVSSAIGNVRLNLGHAELSLTSPVAALLSSGEGPLSTNQFLLGCLQVPWIGNPFSTGQCSQPRNTKVNSDSLTGLGKFLNFLVQVERHEVAPRTVLGYRNRSGGTFEASGPTNLEYPKLCDYQCFVLCFPLESRGGVLSRLLSRLLFEGRVACSLFKEVLVGSLQMPERLLDRDTRYFTQPGVIRLLLEHSKRSRGSVVVEGLACAVAIGAQAKSPIVDVAARAEGSGKLLLLLPGWVGSESVLGLHKNSVALVGSVVKGFFQQKGERHSSVA